MSSVEVKSFDKADETNTSFNNAKTDIDAAGYFNSASDLLKVGDLIYVHASTGGTRTYSLHPVVSNASGVVDIGDGTAISATDSD